MLTETAPTPPTPDVSWRDANIVAVAEAPRLRRFRSAWGSAPDGLTTAEATERLEVIGPNTLRTHKAQPLRLLARQLRSPLLLLLAVTATLSFFLSDRSDAIIIGLILVLSVGLGFINEYRAELAAEALHSQVHHRVTVRRDNRFASVDVTELAPGDMVHLEMGAIVPADIRLVETTGLECDESVLTGESLPVEKTPQSITTGAALAEMTSCTFMGTIVHEGSGQGMVVATGGRTEFGRIALGLAERAPETEFQVGLRDFSMLLVRVAAVLTVGIFVANLILRRPLLESLLFSLAIAVGITPQLLPAVVTTSLAAGARQLARKKVLVKRLVCIEDLGNIEVLFTDKTGTLTEGLISFERALDGGGDPSTRPLLLGLLCNEASVDEGTAVGGNALDVALWEAPDARGRFELLPASRPGTVRSPAAHGLGPRRR